MEKPFDATCAITTENRRLVQDTNKPTMVIQKGVVVFCNGHVTALLGIDRETLTGRRIWSLIDPLDREEVFGETEPAQEQNSRAGNYSFRFRLEGSNSLRVMADCVKIPWGGDLATLMLLKVTEREKVSPSVIGPPRQMDSMANLAGGITHQFNNILFGITGNVELIRLNFPHDKTLEKYLDRISAAANRMVKINKLLVAFARVDNHHVQRVPFARFVKNFTESFRQGTTTRINFCCSVDEYAFYCDVDLARLDMALCAVLKNAQEAVDGRGKIRVEVGKARAGKVSLMGTSNGAKPNGFSDQLVYVRVSDNGIGMDAETKSRMFEPFFSTKFAGRGLDLAAVQGIVASHSGFIHVESEPGRGTDVTIYLPTVSCKKKSGEGGHNGNRGSRKTILLIDQEEIILRVGGAMLEKQGFGVVTARSKNESIQFLSDPRRKVDLTILDMGLPETDSINVYQFLKQSRPEMKILFSNGFSDNHNLEKLRIDPTLLVQKPFSFHHLSSKISRMFHQAENG